MSIKGLLDKNILKSGDVLIWDRKQLKNTYTTEIHSSGKIITQNGIEFNSPSGAARHFSNGIAVDGWRVWKVQRLNKTLGELRNMAKNSQEF
jgi:hypothetical protein